LREINFHGAPNLGAQIKTHDDGRGAAHTFKHRPFRLVYVYSERFLSMADASARERQLKRWSREKKAALIAGNPRTFEAPQQAPLVELIFLMPALGRQSQPEPYRRTET
jgi:predicted GIY-YIG superfamily endonuclease